MNAAFYDTIEKLGGSSHAVRWSGGLGVACWHDCRSFYHQVDGSFRSSRSMDNALRNYKTFLLLQLDNSIFKVNDKLPVQNKEELNNATIPGASS